MVSLSVTTPPVAIWKGGLQGTHRAVVTNKNVAIAFAQELKIFLDKKAAEACNSELDIVVDFQSAKVAVLAHQVHKITIIQFSKVDT